jgi:hypothetical protein
MTAGPVIHRNQRANAPRLRVGAIQSDALTLRTFAIRLVSITAASLRFPSELATVMTVDAKLHANFRGRLKNCQ